MHKLLIANRGEIACRIIRTARRMGIATVAVYSDADAKALHVEMADAAVAIGPALARDSYLNIPAILAAARSTGADALHPGYGFLSENPELADACAAAGLTFVGPPAAAMRAMGLKAEAKAIARTAGVPVLPGYDGEEPADDILASMAETIGYPVMINAIAGGGGRGMRRVDQPDAFAKALAAARREASSSFGDARVMLEKFLSRPRHIEIQVFADQHGQAVHLFERDCSLQRRNQKILEEAPAPGMSAAMRASMGAAALKLVHAVGYVGAGTVEFIADVADGLHPDRFYFLEMNTRLQVEHPVTEMITGLDLVEWQIRIARGEALPTAPAAPNGHAVEVRLCAEDPRRNFLPSPGTLTDFTMPPATAQRRIDTGVRAGDEVTQWYDPLLGKLIVYAPTRHAALDLLAESLAACTITGVRTNRDLLHAVALNPAFRNGEVETGFLAQRMAELLPS